MGVAAVAGIRHAEARDAEAIARIQVAGWRDAYGHILPAAFLAELDEARRAEGWRGRIGSAARADSPTFVATDDADTVIGFTHVGPSRDDDLDSQRHAEIYTLYVDPAAWRRGIGTALVAEVDRFAGAAAFAELTLWVFERNASGRAFYEHVGFRADGASQVDEFGGASPVEVRYRRPVAGTV